jgi:hypothetical protein
MIVPYEPKKNSKKNKLFNQLFWKVINLDESRERPGNAGNVKL